MAAVAESLESPARAVCDLVERNIAELARDLEPADAVSARIALGTGYSVDVTRLVPAAAELVVVEGVDNHGHPARVILHWTGLRVVLGRVRRTSLGAAL